MANTSRKSAARAAKGGKPMRATKVSKAPARGRSGPDAEAHIDACDLEFLASEATPDADLPEARGGVEGVRGARARTARRGR